MNFHNALCAVLERPSRKSVLKLRILPRRYLEEMGYKSHSSLKGIKNYFANAARTRINLAALVKETPIAAQAATKNSTTAKMKMSASESCIRK